MTQQVRKPEGEPKFNGEIRKSYDWLNQGDEYWKWNGNDWELAGAQLAWWNDKPGVFTDREGWKELTAEYKRQQSQKVADAITVTAGKIPAASVTALTQTALRYPSAAPIDNAHDYVTFQFYKYAPPFRKRQTGKGDIKSDGKEDTNRKEDLKFSGYDYNQASKEENQYTKKTNAPAIVLYMPEDISTGFRSNWTGKAFGNFATNALMTAGAEGGVDQLKAASNTVIKQMQNFIPITGAKALAKVVKTIGGDTIDVNDITSGMSGAILNPNVEMMYGGADLRNFSLNFKLVPRNQTEAGDINQICNEFKKAMLPKMDPGDVLGSNNSGTFAGFIGVPDLCRVAFMHGGNEHDALPRFKMCAITSVDVNYTPDGAYATYFDGQPAAVQLTVSFQETKLVFSEEIGGKGGIR